MPWGDKNHPPRKPRGKSKNTSAQIAKKIRQELQGQDCEHKTWTTYTNRHGEDYKECDKCHAWLGWV